MFAEAESKAGVWSMGVHYSDKIIEEILDKNEIISVVSDYVKLERKGSNYWGLCPFHNEKTPSFSVAPTKQIYYCFGCQKGGNAINFISSVENIGYYDAIQFLAEKSGVALPEGNDEKEIERTRIRKAILEVNLESARFFRNNLLESKLAQEYFSARNLSERIVKSFGLGYAVQKSNELYNHLKGKGFNEFILNASGLFSKDKRGNTIDRYRNRVMFPIFDLMGNVIAFGGRVLDDSKPKYINSPETPAYHKGSHLYAMNFAKKHQTKQLIIVEGYMDVISLHQAGITNVVASLGTALTDSQGRILKKYCDEVIISYDADGAGQKAAMRGLDILNNLGCRVKVLKIPDGKDPDDYVKKNGADRFNALTRSAMSLIEYKAEFYTKNIDINTIEGKSSFMYNLCKVLASIENMVEREMYIKRFSKLYDVSEQALLYDVAKMTNQDAKALKPDLSKIAKKREQEIETSSEREKISHMEMLLLTLLCSDNTIYTMIKGEVIPEWFTVLENKELAQKVLDNLKNGIEVHNDMLLDLAGEERRNKFAEITMNDCNFDNEEGATRKAVKDIIVKRDSLINGIRRNELIELLSNPDISLEDKDKYSKELKGILLKNR